jgi:uncharacterized protein (TIGR00255 family)
MTGHGQAIGENDQLRVAVEIRTVNNRFLKLNISSDLGTGVESKIESLLKSKLHRGSVSVRVKTTYLDHSSRYRLNAEVIQGYWTQLSEIAQTSQTVNLESVLRLPGVVDETSDRHDETTIWPTVESAVTQAIDHLTKMRQAEGAAMKVDMLDNIKIIDGELDSVKTRAPRVVQQYSARLTDRINKLLEDYEVSITAADVVKEVGIFADRGDVSEETVRLSTHLDQFNKVIQQDVPGKKLDFLVQEMLRETNTIGSKANDSEIAQHVVEIKTAIERIREMVQNIE